ncbi:SMI1/KNR4 family protein [Neisseria dumasiana]|uniref:Cell wall assembly protein n=1 Tax=Neisseria dumasiana TaxID=1931275 RepID=A0ABX3WHS3_9NEIS|nr:SMI1/KNR4 family protein [Neisseria dumasiana]OSI24579.1 cell wall assembly protein [Neisseria dumasiana]UOO83570.1 SMI1/KNR4 family protein [Neisseria dumasiana]
MRIEIMNLLHEYFRDNPDFRGSPAKNDEIKNAENILDVKFNDDYVEFIKTFGGACVGIDVHAFDNPIIIGKETVIELTQGFQKLLKLHGKSMNKFYAISDDGSGNPIIMNEEGKIAIYYHDSSDFEILYESFEDMLKETLLS